MKLRESPTMGRSEVTTKVQHALGRLRKAGVSFEKISVEIGLSYHAIQNWKVGRRVPRPPTLHRFEQICATYGVKL